ncbi:MAG: EAL domain-containing protein [Ketobacteraceae bacterium]|nr:EAL domain-containing protein [Ketobacteraceae bacterium]
MQEDNQGFSVVAIGASAGGLEALKQVIHSLPLDLPCAFVVLQHLDPSKTSRLTEILRLSSQYTILQAVSDEPLKQGYIYCVPAGYLAEIRGGKIVLTPVPEGQPRFRSNPIDKLFYSLAESKGSHAIGVILSGAGQDGARGFVKIRNEGGLTIAESPSHARFPSMPEAAIQLGHADLVLPPMEIGLALKTYLSKKSDSNDSEVKRMEMESESDIREILALVGKESGNDFSGYKSTTLKRRIDRRMSISGIDSHNLYLDHLKENAEERKLLANDMLISVTQFFRDPEAYEVLQEQALPELFKGKEDNQAIRIWVAGCATGEEAYSIALLLFAYREKHNLSTPIQIFASDIDSSALDVARAGLYNEESVRSLPRELLERYFIVEGDGYRISKDVRSSIVFALHNLVSDPPFSRLDMIICRNVLIYLEQPVQRNLMSLFSAVLNKGGMLFLGTSETIGLQENRFEVISKQWRIFRNIGNFSQDRNKLLLNTGTPSRFFNTDIEAVESGGMLYASERDFKRIVDTLSPALLLINEQNDVIYTQGEVKRYVSLSEGAPSYHVFNLLHPALRSRIRPLISKVRSDDTKVEIDQVPFADALVRIHGSPVREAIGKGFILLAIEEQCNTQLNVSHSEPEDSWLVMQLEQELQSTREDLQRTIDKMRLANEDLRVMNEEFVAMNEELQSSNEELESSKEELQSLNEELQNTNSTLDAKVYELELVNNDLANLISSTDIATVFLDKNLNIMRFTPATTRIMHLKPHDIGRPFTDIAHVFKGYNLLDSACEVLAKGIQHQSEVTTNDGQTYIRRVLPYRIDEGPIAGLVVTFVDVSEIRNAREKSEQYALQLQRQNQLLELPIVFARDLDDKIIFWNAGVEKFYGWSREQALGQVSHDLLKTEFPQDLDDIIHDVLSQGFWNGELRHHCASGRVVTVDSHWALARDRHGEPWAVLELNNDISDRVAYQSELEYLANNDPVTQLPNQSLLLDLLQKKIQKASQARTSLALLLLDLDRFKNINDSLGHEIGNQLLMQVAERLQGYVNNDSFLARFGGDEFALLVGGRDIVNRASHLCDDLLKTFAEPFWLDNQEIFVGVSIGVSIYPEDSTDAEGLLKSSDSALNVAKSEGRGQYCFFTPKLNRQAHRHLAIEVRLHKALEKNELYLHFQPQISLKTGKVVAAEALMRWHNEDLGSISPGEFIPIAEESGLILKLGEWALMQVVEKLRSRQREGKKRVRLAVNISPLQFRNTEFLEKVAQIVSEGGFNPNDLEFELTESLLISSPENAVETFARLRSLGIRLSFDDFGTGYCSLQYLRHLRLHHLKVAREFIPCDTGDQDNISISKAIVSLSHSLGIECTVEGVEGEKQMQFFRSLGCELVQGFYFSPAVPYEELDKMVAGRKFQVTK